MNPDQFAETIKSKYPQYKDVDNLTLSKKMVEKYPIYASKVNFNQKTPGYFQRIGQSYTQAGEDIISGIKQGAKDIEGGGMLGGVRAGLRTVGGVAKAAFAPIVEAPIIKQGIGLAGKGIQKLSETEPIKAVGEAVSPLTEKLMGLAQKHPESTEDIEDIISITTLGVGKAVSKPLAGVTGKTLTKVGGAIERGASETIESKQGAFVRKLIRPEQTKAVKEAQVSRTTEQGSGIFKKSVIEPTPEELASERAVRSIPEVSSKNTNQRNYNIIKEANKQEAIRLEQAVEENNFIIPRKEVVSRLNATKENLAKSPTLVGDAEKTADKLLAGAIDFVNKNEGTGKGLLKAKKEYDAWVLSQKPKAFDGTTENAFTIANREVRNVFKDILDQNAPNAKVKASLGRQHALFNAMDNIEPKAAIEADTAIGRAFQNMATAVGIKNKLVQQVAAIVGIGGLGAAATFAPVAAVAGGTGFLMYQAGKLVLKPQIRVQLGRLLKEVGNAITPKDRRVIENAIKGKEITDGLIRVDSNQ